MLQQIDLYNGALLLLKETSLATLTEAREPRYLLDQVWNEGGGAGLAVTKACLEQGGWVFAKRTARLDYDSNVNPTFGYQYACDKPSDYVRLMDISADDQFMEPNNQYNEEGGYFFSPYSILYIRYVSDDPSYGGDMTKWPASFIEYVKSYLAYKIVGRLTGTKTDPQEILKEMNRALANAQGKDAIERPASFGSRGSWVRSRAGRRGFTDISRSK
jgi:hypothetical protein